MLQKLVGELGLRRSPMSLAPSAVHFLLLEQSDCPELPPAQLPCLHQLPRLQVAHKDKAWFALNNAQLHLFRTLERAGKCATVPVDVVSLQRVPPNLRNLMVVKTNLPGLERVSHSIKITDTCPGTNILTAATDQHSIKDKQGVTETQLTKESTKDTEVAAGVQTTRGYHALVQTDPHDGTSDQSDESESTDGSSEESDSDQQSVHSESVSDLGSSDWSDEGQEESDTDDDGGDYVSTDSSESVSTTASRERLDENDCLL